MNAIGNLDLLSVAVAVAGTFVLGFTVFFTNRKSVTNRTFLLFSMVTGVWGLVNFFGYKITNPQIAFPDECCAIKLDFTFLVTRVSRKHGDIFLGEFGERHKK